MTEPAFFTASTALARSLHVGRMLYGCVDVHCGVLMARSEGRSGLVIGIG